MFNRSTAGLTILGSLAIVVATPAHAQNATIQSVSERETEAHRVAGLRVGSIVVRPYVLGAVNVTDNVYATANNTESDVFFSLRGAVEVDSDFSRHALDARAYVDRSFYTKNTTEDATQYGAQLGGRYDIGANTRFLARVGYDRLAESRGSLSSFRQASSRVTYGSLRGSARLEQDLGPLKVAASGRLQIFRYYDVELNGTKLSQDFRDFSVAEGTLDVGYRVSDLTRVVARGTIERRRYVLRPGDIGFDPITQIDRSANGFRLEGGIARELTALLRGTIRVGYLRYTYADPRLRNVSALSYHADLEWNVTPLTTIQFGLDRRLDESISPTIAGNLRDEARVAVSHELLRNLVLLGDARYASIRPSGNSANSREFELNLGARYYIGRRIRVEAGVQHAQRVSSDPSIVYRANSGRIGVAFNF